MKVSILGAGSWGTALAIHLARSGHGVLLWSRDSEVAAAITREHRHPRRLPGIPIPEQVRTTSDLGEAFEHSETLLLSVPCAAMREVLDASPGPDHRARRFVSTAKGIEPETLKRMTEIVLERYPSSSAAALSGPTFAEGVARGDPSAAVIADHDDQRSPGQHFLANCGLVGAGGRGRRPAQIHQQPQRQQRQDACRQVQTGSRRRQPQVR